VRGNGDKFGVYSGGHLGVANGKQLKCSACVTAQDLATNAVTKVYAGYNNGPEGVPYSTSQIFHIGSLSLPSPGQYSITAKAWVESLAGTALIRCRLSTAHDFDDGQVDVTDPSNGILTLMVNTTVTGADAAELRCQNRGNSSGINPAQLNNIRITAVRVSSLTNEPLS
jgi:hypothetical protein